MDPDRHQSEPDTNQPATINDVVLTETESPANDALEDDRQIGPVGNTGIPTFDTVWVPGVNIPSKIDVVVEDDNAELIIVKPTDNSYLAALIQIANNQAATEYHFDNAIPAGYSAKPLADGSIRFYDNFNRESGGIAAPWAFDSTGNAVPTSYRLDGSTLIQAVEHKNAVHPVVADPAWFAIFVPLAFRVALLTPTLHTANNVCQQTQCIATATRIVQKLIQNSNENKSSKRKFTPSCNPRVRVGC